MDIRSPLNQCIALSLAGILFLNPIVAAAAGLALDKAAGGNTGLGQAGNGVPVVNIATPNGAGLSNNHFRDYNVGANGLILNNATGKTQGTQLGGIILGNPNLKGQAAQVILNQVTGGNRSTLAGYTEVAGQSARVIVANPHGITCQGCGFINTPRATLTTGKPIMDGQRLERFQVDGGDIVVEGAELNVGNLEQFDLITRSAKLNAKLYAKNLNIVTGRNDVQADSLQATPRAADGSEKPQLAIDSSALGGMYAGAIRLVGTEQGVGVRLAGDMAASGGDIRIDASGKLSLAQASSQGDLKIAAQAVELNGKTYAGGSAEIRSAEELVNRQSLAARERIVLEAAHIDNAGVIEAGVEPDERRNARGDLELRSGTLRNAGSLVASRALEAKASQALDNQGGSLKGATVRVDGGHLDNRGGKLLAEGELRVEASSLDNRQDGLLQSRDRAVVKTRGDLDNRGGQVIGLNDLEVGAATLDNGQQGLLGSQQSTRVSAQALVNRGDGEVSGKRVEARVGSLDNRGGKLIGDDLLVVASGAIDNRLGLFSAANRLDLRARSLDNSGKGTLSSRGGLEVSLGGLLDNRDEGSLLSQGAQRVTVGQLDNRAGGLLSSRSELNVHGASLDNRGGVLVADAGLSATGGAFDNRDGGSASGKAGVRVEVASLRNDQGGKLLSDGRLDLAANAVGNAGGRIAAKGDLQATLGSLAQQGGELVSEKTLKVAADTLDNSQSGLIAANGGIAIEARQVDNRAGEISSTSRVAVNAREQLDNRGGKVIGDSGLRLTVQRLLNQAKGVLAGRDGLSLDGGELFNGDGGRLDSQNSLSLSLGGVLDNQGGALVSEGSLTARAAHLDNRGGAFSSAGALALTSQAALDNQGGRLLSDAGVTLKGASLDNSRSGVISAKGAVDIRTGVLDNSRNGGIGSNAGITLVAARLDNGQQGRVSAKGLLDANLKGLDQRGGGVLVSEAGVTLDLNGGTLVNRDGGLIATPGALLLRQLGVVDNGAGGEISSDRAFTLAAASLDNRGGRLIGADSLTLRIAQALDNSLGGVISGAAGLDIAAARLDNSAKGTLASRAGNLDLQSGSLDNGAGGVLNSAKGWLKLVTGLFDNSAGVTQAQSLEIRAGQGVRNQQGHLSALGGDNRIVTADFDNQGGGLYASGLLSLDGQRFLNQGAAAGQGGKVGAGRIDFSLAGALANRFGQLESESELHLRAAAIDNSGGSLRALGRSGSTRLVAGDLNNAYGVLESANQDLDLQLGSLANAGGRILHTGNGTFGLDSGQVIRAGGELTTNGLLDIRASEWTNSSVLQAGRLNLDIGTFRQTAEGKLLAVQSFTGRGGDWSNDGLLASDGSLRLELSGGYRGNGRATSLGDFALNAASLDLGDAASLAGGANVTLGAGNLLVNRGRITAAGDLVASAASLNNYGTLGGGGNLRLNAPALLNERGLLFSGADMTLRAGDITNLYGDVYSLGRLDIARDDAGNRAASLRNLSGVIESGKDFSLRASLIENRRAVLESKSGLYTAKMEQTACIEGVNAGDCSGKRNAIWTITQRDKTEVTASSAMGQLLAGGDFAIDGGTLNNLSSLIGSGGNLTANLEVLDNQGLETGELETIRVLRTARGGDIGGIDQKSRNFTNLYWYQSANFDPARAGEIPAALNAILSDWSFEYEFPSKGPTPISSGDQSYAAVIQAAGDVTVNASTRIDNGVTRPGYTFVGSGRQVGDSAVGGSGVSVVVPLTSQLPPDLARRQVNPVTLPGFSLPQGDNGLFRLSSRFAEDGNGSAALGAGADRTQGGSGVSVGQQGAGNVAGTWQGQGVRVDGLAGAANVQGQGGSTLGGSLPGVARVQGVPGNATPSASHKYLIETNPALTELKQFLNSDYLLSGLGMNPDDSKKRLGDGLYEQRLIRDAVVARTGQRYIDGLSSDEALFRYLMDNAIAYKDKLQLQLGVGLSAEQMAALTHDIVWLEEVEVNGEKVLAPVVYLAQAEGRLAPNGALIQGRDVKLVSGGDLHNVGTLRARNDLSATADNLDNSGLIEAGKRLDLLAGDSIRNRQGGVIAGRDVSLTALTGDVINERSVTRYDSALDGRTWERSFADSAARVEAANSLNVQAGRDIANLGGVLQSRGDLSLDAGRDVTVAAVEDRQGQTRWNTSRLQSVTQLGAEVSAGRDLNVSAGRDLSAVASALEARRDIALSAGRDVTLAAAANEEHAYSKTRKVTYQEDKVAQQGTRVDAGGDLAINAGQDLRLIASQASAGDEAYLVAGDKLELLAANDSNYYLYDKKKKGDFGRKETRRDEVTDVKAVGSQISSGGDLTLLSGGDQTYQGAKLESGNDLAIVSGGAVTFDAVKDLHQESHEKSKGDLAWQSSKGKGQTDETVRQSQIVAQGNLAIKAVEGLKIDLKHIDQKTVSQTIDAMVQADPQLAWLKEAEQRGDVDWRMVQEVHDSWKYSNSGMGPATQIAVAIAAAAIGGMAAAGALSGAGVGASSFAMGAGVGAAGSLSGTAAVSLINNKGDLGKVLKDSFSSDSLKQIAIASLTGGLTAEYFDGILQTKTDPLTGKVTVDLSSLSGVGRFAANQAMQNATSTVLSQALGQGGSLNEALKSALYNSFAAAGFNFVGDIGQEYSLKPGDPSMVTMHALMGGLAAQVSGGDFATGAAAAGANEALVAKLDQAFKSLSPENREAMVTMGSQLVGVLAAAVRDPDVTGKALESAAWVAKNSTQYNFLNHQDVADLDNALQKCKSQGNCRQVEEEFKARSDENRRRLNGCVAAGNCAEIRAEIDAGSTALNELVARQETANPGGSDSDIAYGFLMGRNVVDWTTAGQLHLEQTANLWWNGNPQWQKEVGAYLDQTGFNPFGIGVPAMGGAAGKVSAKALMNALKAGELPKGEVAPGKANLPTIGALADAEAGMPYTHPIKTPSNETARLLASSQEPYKGGQSITNAGRAVTKHPEYFGFSSTQELRKMYRTDSQINELAGKAINEILQSGVKSSGAGGRYPGGWITYTLPDGRAASWGGDGKFIGFRGVQK
ncbi:TPA: DUF637 domain-containing protein [Pseudomonas aeruginosa]